MSEVNPECSDQGFELYTQVESWSSPIQHGSCAPTQNSWLGQTWAKNKTTNQHHQLQLCATCKIKARTWLKTTDSYNIHVPLQEFLLKKKTKYFMCSFQGHIFKHILINSSPDLLYGLYFDHFLDWLSTWSWQLKKIKEVEKRRMEEVT